MNPGGPVHAAEFPIPMRGNETGCSRVSAGCEKFPIPMRGNESGEAQGPRSRGGGFPIPMRGNELKDESWDGLLMLRGNERWVPDPHEG